MSLLLDALKKAAADKEKAGQSVAEKAPDREHEPGEADDLPEIDEAVFEQTGQQSQQQYEKADDAEAEAENEIAEEELNLELDENFELPGDAENPQTPEPVEQTQQAKSEQSVAEQKPAESRHEVEPPQQEAPVSFEDTTIFKSSPLPVYRPDDARRILEVSQKRYRNNQRVMYYGMYVFAALLFFVASYLYYTAETLDNSQQPVFKPLQKTTPLAQNTQVIQQPETALVESTVEKNTLQAVTVKPVSTAKKKNIKPAMVANKSADPITIVRQKKPDPLSVVLNKAYEAYQAKQYNEADRLYRQVLQRDAKQRDALLGRAAIAMIQNRYADSKVLYQQTLRLYPEDTIATSALVDLVKKEAGAASESELKVLLRNEPDAAHLYFSLGLIYARQDRVAESQQAFFDAYSLKQKADYAYNLAVMLDKMQQPKAALVYYKKASELADKEAIHFEEKKALERIEQLESSHE